MEKTPLTSALVEIPELLPSINKLIILPESAVPSIAGVESLINNVVVVIDGVLGAVVSISIGNVIDNTDTLPTKSVAVTVSFEFPASNKILDKIGKVLRFSITPWQ